MACNCRYAYHPLPLLQVPYVQIALKQHASSPVAQLASASDCYDLGTNPFSGIRRLVVQAHPEEVVFFVELSWH
jgi:hypothetical protein